MQDQILAYFNGQLSPSEEEDLLFWIKENEENRSVFLHIKNKLDPDKMDHPLLTSSYSELKSKLVIKQQFKSVQPIKLNTKRFSIWKIAAMLVLAAVSGFMAAYLLTGGPSPKTSLVWFETLVPRGEKSLLLLPDGSKVWMNSESSLSYPANFMDGNRNVKLNGEAYFEVAKHNGSVFTVETPDYNVRVLGTKFNLMAYENFNRTETTLIEGMIEIQKGKQIIDVVPGQTFTYKDNQFFSKETKAAKSSRWKDDVFDFDQITFQEMVIRLERWYDVDIEIRSEELKQITYSGVFKNEETIEEVLNTFQLTMPIRYTRDGFRKFNIRMNK
jgi:ferric-dicitrate binding protein FerR (iron transport regulator)